MNNIYRWLLFFLVISSFYSPLNAQELDPSKQYNQVSFVTTHNAYNYGQDDAFLFPNNTFPISQQLVDGVRGFMLDVYVNDTSGQVVMYHSFEGLGSELLVDVLGDIKVFMDENPTEIITLILESYVTAEQFAADIETAGLLPYTHTQVLGEAWPTIQEMRDSNQRLVVLSDTDDGGEEYPWYMYMWDFAVETHYSNHRRTDLTCDYNRGDAENDLFILNAFITNSLAGFGLIDSAAVVNEEVFLSNYCLQCAEETGKRPNFVTIDFHEVGDAFAVVNSLNDLPLSVLPASNVLEAAVKVYPNPVVRGGLLGIDNLHKHINIFELTNNLGCKVYVANLLPNTVELAVPSYLAAGWYIYVFRGVDGKVIGRGKVVVE